MASVRFPEAAEREWHVAERKIQASQEYRASVQRKTLVEREVEKLLIRSEATDIFTEIQEADNIPELEMMTLEDYKVTPDAQPKDLIEGAVSDNALLVLIGPSRAGKTTQALQMAWSLVTGNDWLGQKVNKVRDGIGVMSYDMDGRRVLNWAEGMPGLTARNVSVVNAYKSGNPLAVRKHRDTIARSWRERSVDVVIIDSFSASFFGGDQNDAAATMAHYRDLKNFALNEVGARLLIVIAHSTDSNPEKVRGSTVHTDTADNHIVVYPNDRGQRVVMSGKYRTLHGANYVPQMTPVIVTAPDPSTNLVKVDLTAMTLENLPIPVRLKQTAARLFPKQPNPNETATALDADELGEEGDEIS